LLATGQETKKQATAGLLGAARLEAQQDIANQQLEMQKDASIQQAQGTVVGIGGAVAARSAAGAITKGAGFAANAGSAIVAAAPPVAIALAAAFLLKKIFD
jgi:hypothetical protein